MVVKTFKGFGSVFSFSKYTIWELVNRIGIKKETFPWKNGKVSFFLEPKINVERKMKIY